jgi:hypothetical protein
LNSNPRHFNSFTFISVLFEESICLSRGVQVAGATCRAATRIVAGVGNLVQRTEDGRTSWILDYRTIERSSDVVCGLHRTCGDVKLEFLG